MLAEACTWKVRT